jgi:hypothetical protein
LLLLLAMHVPSDSPLALQCPSLQRLLAFLFLPPMYIRTAGEERERERERGWSREVLLLCSFGGASVPLALAKLYPCAQHRQQHGTGAPRDSRTGGAAARVLPGCAKPSTCRRARASPRVAQSRNVRSPSWCRSPGPLPATLR